jgi:acetyl-CoA carboxylase carboxyltransferase component
MDGYPVGVVAHNPRVFAGALTVQAADKHTRFVDLCNAFNLPLVLFVDTPGFMIGKQAEQSGLLRAGMRAVVAGVQAKVPHVAIYVRKSYGMAGDAIGCIGGASSVNLRFGWPSGEWGSIPIEGGVAAAYRRQIESAPDPEAARLEIERRLQANRSPFRVAEAFEILDIVDPRETRPLVCRFVAMAQAQLARLTSEPKAAVRP